MTASEEYRSRLSQWSDRRQRAQRAFIAIGNWRLVIALLAIAIAYFAFGWWLLLPLALFIALVAVHQRVIRRRTFADRAIGFYHHALRRIEDGWSGAGNRGEEFRDPNHIYSEDLDVFGRGSLFEMLSNARTAAGERRLADWLLHPAPADQAKERQQSIRELAPKLNLREDIALLGEDIKAATNVELLTAWGLGAPVVFPVALRIAALLLSLTGLLALVLKLAGVWPPWPIVAVLGVNAAVMFVYRRQTAQVQAGIESAAHDLGLFSLLIKRLELEQFTSPGLMRLHSSLNTTGACASRRIQHLDRWLELLDSSDHVILRLLSPLLLYKQQIVMAIEAWRANSGAHVGRWIHALAEFEALSSLGALHYERPDWCFPTLDNASAAHFAAVDMGHPLLPAASGIRNSLALDDACRLLIVSGSNMSGKSTLLRAVGLNTVLAWAGAPVCAASLALSPLQTAASLRVSDSLQDNRSRFFAEISRLRQIVELTQGALPVLFLLDELLSGTNSHDRKIGAAGIVRGLLNANTIGLLTTHDLALAELDQAGIRNVHFEDKITGGAIEFDYRLRPGVVTHSNALELMRSIGLDI